MASPLLLERPGSWRISGVLAVLLVAASPGLPLAWSAFVSSGEVSGDGEVLLGSAFAAALRNSGTVALLVSAIAFLVGLPAGVCAGLYDFPGRKPLLALLAIPLLVPSFLWAIGWSALAARLGLGLIGGVGGCVLVFSGPATSLVLLASFAASQSLSSTQVESARLAGGERAVLLHTSRTVAFLALLAAALGGVLTLQDPGPGQILGLKSAAGEILTGFSAFFDFALAGRQCVALTLLVLLAIAPLAWFAAPRIAGQVLAKQTQRSVPGSRSLFSVAAAVTLGAIALIWIVLPLLGLLLPLGRDTQFVRAWSDVLRTGADTLVYALGAGVVAVILALTLAFCVGRSALSSRIAIAAAIVLVSLPSAFTALGVAEVAGHAPAWSDFVLRSRFTVCLVLGLRFFPVAAVLVLRAWSSVSSSWTLAAAVAGVPLWRYAFRVLLPVLAPGLAMACVLVALLATADVGTVLLLHPPGHASLPLTVFTIMANAPEARLASLCLLYVVLAGGIVFTGWSLARRMEP